MTSEYVQNNSNQVEDVPTASDWNMTSGSLFWRQGVFWTGVPDDSIPDRSSQLGNNSAVFRLTTASHDFGDVAIRFRLRILGLVTTGSTPARAWDGVHVFLRYQNEENLYYASVQRRNGQIVIKKKCLGGTENGGTYYDLGAGARSGFPIRFDRWQDFEVRVQNLPDGVRIRVIRDGAVLISATDRGIGCDQIRRDGAVGFRGDNANFEFADLRVTPLAP